MAADGTLHLLYYSGDPKAGDLFYVTRAPGKTGFSAPIRVNSQPGSAIAMGNDRGGQLALGRNGRVHVAWNGSSTAEPKGPRNPAMPAESPHNGLPMLYARLSDKGDAFEPQRNLMTSAFGLDGGGSVAAGDAGHIFVAFHADPPDASGKSETERRVFLAASIDDGATFAPERAVSPPDLGACGCCGLKAFASADRGVNILFRAAARGVDRDMIWLRSNDLGAGFDARPVHPWRLNSCPMTTAAFAEFGPGDLALAWETNGNVFYQARPLASDPKSQHLDAAAPPGAGDNRKYPAIAVTGRGYVLLAWTEGMTWAHEGTAHWQGFFADGKPIPGLSGSAGPVPAWSLVAAVAGPDGSFTVLY
jgi:hypothetical protein